MTKGKRPNLNFPDGKDFSPSKGKAWTKPFRIRSGIQPNPQELGAANRFKTREAKVGKLPATKTSRPNQRLKNPVVTVHEVILERGIIMCWTDLNTIFFKKKEDEKEIVSIFYTSREYAMFYYEHNRIAWKK